MVVYNVRGREALCLAVGQQCGGLAQLGEHYVRNVGVGGSIPLPSTNHQSLTVLSWAFLLPIAVGSWGFVRKRADCVIDYQNGHTATPVLGPDACLCTQLDSI